MQPKRKRKSRVESLEARQLLAADIAAAPLLAPTDEMLLDYNLPIDVSDENPEDISSNAAEAPIQRSDLFSLHSRPESNFTIFLDFDGHVIEGTAWNNSARQQRLISPAFSLDSDVANFSSFEIDRIIESWRRVAEDFSAFDVNVTTEDPGVEALRRSGVGDTQWGVRALITQKAWTECNCGGVAYIGSFDSSVDVPAMNFNSGSGSQAQTISHEVGHTLGLTHDGNASREYYNGHNSPAGTWGPIMGGPFGDEIVRWSNGDYFEASNTQDDLNIITTTNGFGYAPDDHGDSLAAATGLNIVGSTSVSGFGRIEQNSDVDYFEINVGNGAFDLAIDPLASNGNLDVWAGLYDDGGTLVAESNDPADRAAAISIPLLPAGTYYLKIDGVGSHGVYNSTTDTVEDPPSPAPWQVDPPFGYSDYGSLGYYAITGSIVSQSSNTISVTPLDAVKSEGQVGTTQFTFQIQRNGPVGIPVTFDYEVAIPRAEVVGENFPHVVTGDDFVGGVLPSGSVTLGSLESAAIITVDVVADTVWERDEYFDLDLSNLVTPGWAFSDSTAEGRINADEVQFSLSRVIQDRVMLPEGDPVAGGSTFNFEVVRQGDVGTNETVDWRVESAGLTDPAAANDFLGASMPSGVLNFLPGEVSKIITFESNGDLEIEGDEFFRVRLTNSSASIHPDLADVFGAIVEDESIIGIKEETIYRWSQPGHNGGANDEWALDNVNLAAGTLADTFDPALDPAQWEDIQNGTVNAVFNQLTNNSLRFSGTGTRHAELKGVPVAAGDRLDYDVIMELSSGNYDDVYLEYTVNDGLTWFQKRKLEVDDFDNNGTVTARSVSENISTTEESGVPIMNEGTAANQTFPFFVTRGGYLDKAISFTWEVVPSGADPASPSDFVGNVLPSGTVTFPSGNAAQEIQLLVSADIIDEFDETFDLVITGTVDAIIDNGSATGTILNDDVAATDDFGDAPDTYGTTIANGAASHLAVGPTIGANRTAEYDGQPSTFADLDAPDEDGIIIASNFLPGEASQFTVDVQNAPDGAELEAWIDYDGNGMFDDPTESIFSGHVDPGVSSHTFTVPVTAQPGLTYARFRLQDNAEALVGPTGAALTGEVEDYALTITTDGEWENLSPSAVHDRAVQNPLTDGFINGSIDSLRIHPVDSDVAFAGTTGGAIWRTANINDPAPTWSRVTNRFLASISDLTFDQSDPNIIYAATSTHSTFVDDLVDEVAGAEATGLLKSIDGGVTWFDPGNLALAGDNINSVLATTDAQGRELVLVASSQGLKISEDGGAIFNGLEAADFLFGEQAFSLVADPLDPTGNRIYAAVDSRGIYRTEDFGFTWTKISSGLSNTVLTQFGINAIELAVHDGGRLYVSSLFRGSASQLFFTDNPEAGTVVWDSITAPVDDAGTPIDTGGIIGDATHETGRIFYAMTPDGADPDIVYVAGARSGSSETEGIVLRGDLVTGEWDELVGAIDEVNDPTSGTRYESAPFIGTRGLMSDPSGGLISYGVGGLFRNTQASDNSTDWNSIGGNIGGVQLSAVEYDPGSDIILASSPTHGILTQIASDATSYRVDDFGLNAPIRGQGGSLSVTENVTSTTRYSASADGGERRVTGHSLTGDFLGASTLGLILQSQPFTPIVQNNADPSRFLAGGRGAVLQSTNSGGGFSPIAFGITATGGPLGHAIDFGARFDDPDAAYIGTAAGDIFVSLAGAAFGGTSASTEAIRQVKINPFDATNAWAVTAGAILATTNGSVWGNVTGDLANQAGELFSLEVISGAGDQYLIAGTANGVFFASLTDIAGAPNVHWTPLARGVDSGAIIDLDYTASADLLVAATLGGEIYKLEQVLSIIEPPTGTVGITISAGNLNINDLSNADDRLVVSVDSGVEFIVEDPSKTFDVTSIAGATVDAAGRARIPFGLVTGDIIINTAGGNDSVLLDFANDEFMRGFFIDTGAGIDSVEVAGASFASVDLSMTSPNAGIIALPTSDVVFGNPEDVAVSVDGGVTSLSVDYTAVLSNRLTMASGGVDNNQIILSDGLTPSVSLPTPSSLLAIDTGTSLEIAGNHDFTDVDVSVAAGVVNLTGAIQLAGGDITLQAPQINSEGSITSTSGNIVLDSESRQLLGGAHLQTIDGNIIIDANSVTGTTAFSVGESVIATESGAIAINATAGNNAASGALIGSDTIIESTGTGASLGGISISGTGGADAVFGSRITMGLIIDGAVQPIIRSIDSPINISGFGGDGFRTNDGLTMSGRIQSLGVGANAASITISGTGGPNDSSIGTRIDQQASIETIDGEVAIIGSSVLGDPGNTRHAVVIDDATILSTGVSSVSTQGISVRGESDGVSSQGVIINGSVVESDVASISILGSGSLLGGPGHTGVEISGNSRIETLSTLAGGAILIDGTSGSDAGANGVRLENSTVTAQAGDIQIIGEVGVLSNDGVSVDAGSVSTFGDLTITGNGFGLGSAVSFAGAATIGNAASSSDIRVIGDTLAADVSTIQGAGNLIVEPLNSATTIGIGSTASGTLHLSNTEIGNIADGFALITIGDPIGTGTGSVDINVSVFTDDLRVLGGDISVTGLNLGANDVELQARTGSITNGGNTLLDVTASHTTLVSAGAIGAAANEIALNLNTLSATSDDDQYLSEFDSVQVLQFNSTGDTATLVDGNFQHDGTTANTEIDVQVAATLSGIGENTDVRADGEVSPGVGTVPGIYTVSGALVLDDNSRLSIEIDGNTPGIGLGNYSQLVADDVTIETDVVLEITRDNGFTPSGFDSYTIIDNQGANPVVGEFMNLAEGTLIPNFLNTGFVGQITYLGGDGNDVVVSIVTPEVTLTVTPIEVFEDVNDGIDTAVFTAELSVVSGRDVVIDLSSVGVATAGGVDFNLSGANYDAGTMQLTIPAGTLSQDVTLQTVDDLIFESPDETATLAVASVTEATIAGGTQQATTTILDDEPTPTITLTIDETSIIENGGTATFTLTSDFESSNNIDVELLVAGTASRFFGGPGDPDDFNDTIGALIQTISPGSFSTTFTVTANNDDLFEFDETIEVSIVNVTGGMEDGVQVATTTIINDDALPFITLSTDDPNISETGGSAEVTVDLSKVVGVDVIANLVVSGDATTNLDYSHSSLQITIPRGSTQGVFDLNALPDGLYENDEFIRVDIASVVGADEEFTEQVLVAIIDDEDLPNVILSSTEDTIDEDLGQTTYTVELTDALGAPIVSGIDTVVTLSATGSATDGLDYDLPTTRLTILEGDSSASVTLMSRDDTLNEENETVIIDIIDVSGGVEATEQTHTLTITDDDLPPTVSIAIDEIEIAEDGGVAVVTATSSGVSGRDVLVTLDFTGVAQISPIDFRVSSNEILIPAGQTTGTVTVTSLNDLIDEPNESIVIDVSNVTGGLEDGTQQVTTSIVDDDLPPTVALSIDNTTVDEATGTIVVTATLGSLSGQTVTLDLDLAGTAENGIDYVASSSQIVIPAGSTSGTITIDTVSDLLDEFDETITVDFLNTIGATETGTGVSSTINDDDALPAVRLDVSAADISEVNGTATYTVSLSSPSGREVTVDFGFAGAAIRDDDFDMDAQIVIPAGQTMGTVLLTSMDDTLDEVDELVVVSIASITHGVPDFVSQAETLILDNDAEASVTLTVDNATIAEDGGEATFTAELSTVSGKDITVDVLIAGAATEVADYNHSGLSLFIPAGSSEATVVVTASDDMIDELDETVIVTIDSVTGGTFTAPQTQTTTIVDDEPTPTVSLSSDVSVFDETGGVVTLTATLSEASGLPVSMDLLLSGDALQGTDYLSSEVSLLIPAGETTATFVISSLVDSLDEENESIVVDLINITNATGTTTQSTLSLIDDDATPSILLQAANSEISENGVTTSVFVTLSDISGRDVTVNLGFSGTATEDVDYSVSDSQIVVPAGQSSAGITLTTMDDSLDELTEDIFIEVTTVTNGTEFTPQQTGIDVTDDDAPPSVTLSVDNTSLDETGSVANFTATLSAASGLDVIVDLGFTGTASPGGFDYTVDVSPLVIPAGQTSAVRTVVTENDLLDEDTETIIATIDSVTGATPGGTITAMTSITDDDDMPFLTLTSNQPTISEVGGVGVLLARLSNPSGRDVSFEFELSGSATPGLDFTSTPLVITVPAGSQEATLTLTASDDLLDEFDESIITTLRPISNVLVNTPQTFTTSIVDNDIEPGIRLQIDNGQIAEAGGMAQIDLILSSISGKDILVDLASSGLATIGDDYTLSSSLVTIPAGSDGASVILTAIGDALDEAEETAVIDIGTVTGATETGIQQVVTVIGDDDPTPTVELSVDQLTIDEAAGTAVFTATLSEISGQNVTLSLAFLGDAQGFGVDFDNLTPQLVIPAGQQTGTYTITASDDQLDEIDEAVTISITTASNADIGANNSATTTILDDDQAPNVILTSSLSAIPEAGGTSVVTATLSTVSGKDVTINLGLGGVPVDTVDYSHLGSSIVIPAGSNSGTFTLTALDDLIDELDEVVVIDIASLDGAGEAFDQQVEVTIVDDELAPSVSLLVDNSQIDEAGGIATFTTTLSEVSGLDVTVELIRSGTATLGSDYTETGTTVVIPAGSLSGEYVVSAVNDLINEANEVVDVQISGVTNATVGGSSFNSTQIIDDEPLPVVSLSVDQTDLDELGGQALLTVSISELSGRDVTVNLAASGTALDNIDYALSGTSVTIPAGETEATITLSSISDDLDEVAETVSVDVTSVVNGFESTPQTVQLTIIDDDATPRISLQSSTTTIDELGNTTAVLTATLSSASGRDVFVDAVFSGTATGAGVDYSSSSTQFFIPAGSISHTISVTTVDDALDEVDETVIVNFGQAITGALPGLSTESTITIRDNDPTPLVRLLANRGVIAEGGETAQVAATLSGISGRDVTIELSLTGSATAGTDYTHDPIQLTIPAGSLSTPFSLTSIDDSLDEFNETVTVSVATAIGATVDTAGSASIQIFDNDSAGIVLTETGGSTIVSELGDQDTVTVALSSQPASTVVLNLAIGDDTEGTLSASQLIFTPGNWNVPQSVFLMGVADAISDGLQTYAIIAQVDVTQSDPGYALVSNQVIVASTTDLTVTDFFVTVVGTEVQVTAGIGGRLLLSAPINSTDPLEIRGGAEANTVVVESLEGVIPPLIINTGDGDDQITVSDYQGVTIDGGAGFDTLIIGDSGNAIDLTTAADGALANIEAIDLDGTGTNTLSLTPEDLERQYGPTAVIGISYTPDDIVEFGDGWIPQEPFFLNGQFTHRLIRDGLELQVNNGQANTNPQNGLDTNRNGDVTPVDALVVINEIDESGAGPLNVPVFGGPVNEFYLDVNGDGNLTPIDALIVINFLNNAPNQPLAEAPPATPPIESLAASNQPSDPLPAVVEPVSAIEAFHQAASDSNNNYAKAIDLVFNDIDDEEDEESEWLDDLLGEL